MSRGNCIISGLVIPNEGRSSLPCQQWSISENCQLTGIPGSPVWWYSYMVAGGVVTCMMTVRSGMSYVTLLEDDNKANEVNDGPE